MMISFRLLSPCKVVRAGISQASDRGEILKDVPGSARGWFRERQLKVEMEPGESFVESGAGSSP